LVFIVSKKRAFKVDIQRKKKARTQEKKEKKEKTSDIIVAKKTTTSKKYFYISMKSLYIFMAKYIHSLRLK
jgi:hypothetical protein